MNPYSPSPNQFSAQMPPLQSTGHIVCVFADDLARQQACEALLAVDFDAADLTRLNAEQMRERLDEQIDWFDTDLPNCWQQLDVARRLREFTARESAWLIVLATAERQVLSAQRLLRMHGARRAIHFGSLWIEELAIRR